MASIFFNYFFGPVIILGMIISGFVLINKTKINKFMGYSYFIVLGALFLTLLFFRPSLASRVKEYNFLYNLEYSNIKKVVFSKEGNDEPQFKSKTDQNEIIVTEKEKLEEFVMKIKMIKVSYENLGPHVKWDVKLVCNKKDVFFAIYNTPENLFISLQMKENGRRIGWYENNYLKSYIKNLLLSVDRPNENE